MIAKAKVSLFVALFAIFLVAYLLLPIFPATSGLARLFDIFRDPTVNFAFLIFSFIFLSLALTLLFYGFCFIVRGRDKERAQIGDVMVSEGFINPEDLQEALLEQTRKVGEVLVEAGRITPEQRDHALRVQKKSKRKIGEVLQELGYATQGDIDWAAKQMERRIGEILLDKKKISDYDLTCVTSMNKFIKDPKGNIIVVK
jgi:polyhydroxyalkanoate synthesis regulator phasin